MSNKAKTLQLLYKKGRITREGLIKALEDGVITQDEYSAILGADE